MNFRPADFSRSTWIIILLAAFNIALVTGIAGAFLYARWADQQNWLDQWLDEVFHEQDWQDFDAFLSNRDALLGAFYERAEEDGERLIGELVADDFDAEGLYADFEVLAAFRNDTTRQLFADMVDYLDSLSAEQRDAVITAIAENDDLDLFIY